MLVQINSHRLNIEEYGREDGEAVILLHQGLGTAKDWKDQIPPLIDAGFRVIAYDRWGYGGSDERQDYAAPYFQEDIIDLNAVVEMCLSLNRHSHQKVHMVGHSDGGTIALYFAAQYPHKVASLVTTAAHIYVEEKMKTGIEGVRQAFLHDEGFRRAMRRAHGEKFEQVFRNWYEGWVRPENLAWDMRPTLAEIACPALIIQGMDDEHATPRHAEDIAASISGAELWLVDGAGHMLPQEEPEKFNVRLVEFLAKR